MSPTERIAALRVSSCIKVLMHCALLRWIDQ
jgi:hypothetical protein